MDNWGRSLDRRVRCWLTLLCCLFLIISDAGCQPLKKKFTRKKKATKKEEVQPVLNPIDYPPPRATAEGKYAYHYSLWKVWYKSLLDSVLGSESDKRIRYFYEKGSLELQAMGALLAEPKRNELVAVLEDYKALQKDFALPASLRQETAIERTLRSVDKRVRHEFNPENVTNHLVP